MSITKLGFESMNLHIESESETSVKIAHKNFCEVAQERALSYHSIIILIEDF